MPNKSTKYVCRYRIRKVTEKEKAARVTNEVKKLRHYEETLLVNYQAYLQLLSNEVKAGTTNKQNAKETSALVAMQCMCDLLMSVTHFNFRLNLLTAVITRMSTSKINEMFSICQKAIIKVFQNDVSGEASLDAVRLLSKMIKSREYAVHPEVLNTFLHLRLKDELSVAKDDNTDVARNKKKRKGDKVHLSKKMRKIAKEKKLIEKEMKEADAVVDKEEKEKMQTETLKLVFATYFRILKRANTSPLLLPVLEGLAKFAHLINVDFFDDLLNVLRKIVTETNGEVTDDDDDVPMSDTRRTLLCIITAFQLLSGQGEALNIDLKDFYTSFYAVLFPLALNPNIESRNDMSVVNSQKNKSAHTTGTDTELEMLRKGLDFIFFRRRQIPLDRSAAFIKRLSTSCLNWPSETVLLCLNTIQRLIQKQQRLDALLDSDDLSSNGIYMPELDEPELCNPFATNLWELCLLENHYDPKVRSAATALANFAPRSENG
ncbi:7448_t:CDS:10 [Paraglomus occultum]|uniref:7448_t:CDS:1 n=1 Tax=Paraglomus occultum TaxID=144539 RepID=A0A9N8WL40_9GLOM|nr:7448_t:CDS:10 [Paraglomus occultum]